MNCSWLDSLVLLTAVLMLSIPPASGQQALPAPTESDFVIKNFKLFKLAGGTWLGGKRTTLPLKTMPGKSP